MTINTTRNISTAFKNVDADAIFMQETITEFNNSHWFMQSANFRRNDAMEKQPGDVISW